MTQHLTFVVVPAHGHVNPTLPLVREMVRRGYRVSYLTGEDFADKVRGAGAEFVNMPMTFPSSPPPVASGGLADPSNMGAEAVKQLHQRSLEIAEETFPRVERQLLEDRPDVVCYDAMTATGRLAAEKLDIPRVQLTPSFASNEQFSLLTQFLPEVDFDDPVFDDVRREYRDFSEEHEVSFPLPSQWVSVEDLNLVFVPKEFQLSSETFDERFVFLGPSLGSREHSDEWEPPESEAPVLFISLGTAPFNNRPDFFQKCLEAFADSAWHVVMAVGQNVDLADFPGFPENFEVRRFFPQPAVLRRADVFLSHAGMNSTMESLYCEVPLVTVPQMPEQQTNAQRVGELGVGRVLDANVVTPEDLRKAVDEISGDSDVRARLAELGRMVRESGGPVLGADELESYLAGER